MKANDMRLAFRNFVISFFMNLSLRFFGFSIAPQPNLLAAALPFFISLCGKIMTFCPRGMGQKLTKYGMKNNMFCFVRCFWGADFRIRKPARAYTWQMLVHARKRNLFFGLKILVLPLRAYQNLREGTAPPCRGAGPTGLRGFTPTDTHRKYVFVDVSPLRRFAPPPLQGGGVALQGGATVHVGMPPKVSLSLFPRCLSGWADANGISPKAGGWQ